MPKGKKNKSVQENEPPKPPIVEEKKVAPAIVSSAPSLVAPPSPPPTVSPPKVALVPKANATAGKEIRLGMVKELSSDSMMANNPQHISKIDGIMYIGGKKVVNMFVGNDGRVKYKTIDGKIYV